MGTIVLLALVALTYATEAPESRTWRSVSGSEVDASFVKLQDGAVYLKKADGKEMKIGLDRLSPEDQKIIKQLAEASPAPAPARKVPSWQKAKTEEADKLSQLSPKIKELFGSEIETATGKKVGLGALAGAKKIGIYFSAHWCPPCRAFSPKLVATYNELKEQGKPFELVFVSSDRSADDMQNYIRELKMPWYAVPFKSDKRGQLGQTYGVRGIPCLVIVSDEGKTLSANAVGDVSQSGVKAYDNW